MRISDPGPRFAVDPAQGLNPAPSLPAAAGQLSPDEDQVVLSPAGNSALPEMAARISQLKATVDSGEYDPPSLPVAGKMIAAALAWFG